MQKLKNIYLDVRLKGIVFGNGGYVALAALYEKLAELGYTVYFFDLFSQIDTPTGLIDIRPESSYLSCENLMIVGTPFVRRDNAPKIIISLWMTDDFYKEIVANHWQDCFVFWEHGQLLRKGYEDKIKPVLALLDKSGMPLLISNRYLEPVYKDHLNVRQISYFDCFVRDKLFYYDESEKKPGMVGYQPEARPDQARLNESTLQVTDFLKKHVEENMLLFCTGSHRNVAEKMRQCDIFFWHNLKNENQDLFVGESTGLSHIEALACGCVVIAKENYFTRQIYPRELLCSNLEQGLQKLNYLLSHPDEKTRLRTQCLEIAKNYRFEGFGRERIKIIDRITRIPKRAKWFLWQQTSDYTKTNHANAIEKKPTAFSKDNTCIILVDLWPLSDVQILQLGPAYDAWIYTRERIAELVRISNTHGIPLYLQNNDWPVAIPPDSLKDELLRSNLIIERRAFAGDGYRDNTPAGPPTKQLIKNTVDFRNYENLVYVGYAADACLAERSGYGYASINNSYNKFIIKDATLVQYVLYHGANCKLWPDYSKVRKARSPNEPLPWKTAQDIIDETLYFCDNFASRYCTSLSLGEFKMKVELSAPQAPKKLSESELERALDLRFLMKTNWGWGCFLEDYVLLAGVLAMLRPKKVLEVGTHSGLGAVVLAKAASFLSEPAQVTTIDIDQSKGRANLHLIDSIEDRITFVEADSNVFLPQLAARGERFDFVFIDGAHDYEQALRDWKNCLPLSDTFAFHDTIQFTGLQQLVREIRFTSDFDVFQFLSPPGHRIKPELRKEHFCTGITLVQKKSNLWDIPLHAHRDHYGQLLPGHTD